jgi:hypothetical protein
MKQQVTEFGCLDRSRHAELLAFKTRLGRKGLTMSLSLDDLREFRGTDDYHRLFGNIFLTDGAKYVAKNGGERGALWLMTAIASYQHDLANDRELASYQFWKLEVESGKGLLTCRADSGREPAITQVIDYTDFDLGEIELWCSQTALGGRPAMVICLPSEY